MVGWVGAWADIWRDGRMDAYMPDGFCVVDN